MNYLGDYLKKTRGSISLREMAKRCDISHTFLDSIEKGIDFRTQKKISITVDTIQKLANGFETDIYTLLKLAVNQIGDIDEPKPIKKTPVLTDEEKELLTLFKSISTDFKTSIKSILKTYYNDFKKAEYNSLIAKKRTLPVYISPAAAGDALPILTDEFYHKEVDETVPAHADFGIKIKGDSMEPLITNGNVVWVKEQPAIEPNDIGIFILNNESLCKKLIIKKNKTELHSINKAYDPIKIREFDSLKIVGKVLL